MGHGNVKPPWPRPNDRTGERRCCPGVPQFRLQHYRNNFEQTASVKRIKFRSQGGVHGE
jgi:hypothetical protein